MIASSRPSVKLEMTSQASFNVNKNQASPATSRVQHSVKMEAESQASQKLPTQKPAFGKTFSFRPYFEIKGASSAT